MEGYKCFAPSSGCNKSGKVKPILAYSHSGGPLRGDRRLRVPRVEHPGPRRLVRVRRLLQRRHLGRGVDARASHADKILLRNTSANVSSFGESAAGELFVVDLGGTIYRIDHG